MRSHIIEQMATVRTNITTTFQLLDFGSQGLREPEKRSSNFPDKHEVERGKSRLPTAEPVPESRKSFRTPRDFERTDLYKTVGEELGSSNHGGSDVLNLNRIGSELVELFNRSHADVPLKVVSSLQREGIFGQTEDGRPLSATEFMKGKQFEYQFAGLPFTVDAFLKETEQAIYELLKSPNVKTASRDLLAAAEAVNAFRNQLLLATEPHAEERSK